MAARLCDNVETNILLPASDSVAHKSAFDQPFAPKRDFKCVVLNVRHAYVAVLNFKARIWLIFFKLTRCLISELCQVDIKYAEKKKRKKKKKKKRKKEIVF